MRRLALSFLAGVLVFGAAAFAAYRFWLDALLPYPPLPESPHSVGVTIAPGTSVREAGRVLEREGVVRYWFLVPILARGRGRPIRSGDYVFQLPLEPERVLEMLERGVPPPFKRITIPEGLRIDQVVDLMYQDDLGTCEQIQALVSDPTPVRDLDPAAPNLEGYLFPDTYHLALDAGALELLKAMQDRFRKELALAPQPMAMPVRAWVTLASIVEEETALPEERARVASVYLNRLAHGIPLQCDPTVIYAMIDAGRFPREPLHEDLAIDNRYNTYKNPGLPPGPICSPGSASLRAVLAPEPTGYLFFVATGEGGHQFSTTLAEHNAAVAKYRRYQREHREGS
ncbi:MAG: endolytic transglycosylase MltG [Acidobacteriota bacterium]